MRRLFHHVYFQILCLGETPIPLNAYDFNFDDTLKDGGTWFDFDEKSVGPFLTDAKTDELIHTVESLMAYLKLDVQTSNMNFNYLLDGSCYVFGDKKLVIQFESQRSEYFREHAVARSIHLLTAPDQKCTHARFCASWGHLKPGSEFIHAREDIYRAMTALIRHLGIFCGLSQNILAPYETLDQLKCISVTEQKRLQTLCDYAVRLRYEVYSFYGRRDDKIWLSPAKEDGFQLCPVDRTEFGELFTSLKTITGLFRAVRTFSLLPESKRTREWWSQQVFNELTYPMQEDFFYLMMVDRKEREGIVAGGVVRGSADGVRVLSYNVLADWLDSKDGTEDLHHHWNLRSSFVWKLMKKYDADVICLQELSVQQCLEVNETFKSSHDCFFLSQTPLRFGQQEQLPSIKASRSGRTSLLERL